jgi:DMSO reductase family type II enzyme chaperone
MQNIYVETQPLESEDQHRSANRSRLYLLFSESYRYPDATCCAGLRDGTLARTAQDLLAGLSYSLPSEAGDVRGLTLPPQVEGEEIEVEFVRLFEAGIGGPPCPLVEGLYDRDRKEVLKELIVFFNHFGLSYAEGSQKERPDHICMQMEFLHYLTFKEVHAMQTGADPSSYRRAQRDFLKRHPLSWIGKAVGKIERLCEKLPEDASLEAIRFYRNLLTLNQRFLEADYRYLQNLLEH